MTIQNMGHILRHHLELRGPKGGIFAFGLSSARYVEYSITLDWLISERPLQKDLILELGCGHSIMPSFWKKMGLSVVVLDVDLQALKHQAKVGNRIESGNLYACLARGENLPFKDNSFRFCIAISTIEHFPGDGDVQAVQEMARVLKPGGLIILSVPFSRNSKETDDYLHLIPWVWRRIPRNTFLLFRKFNVDRTGGFFERAYNFENLGRFVSSPSLTFEDYKIFGDNRIYRLIHEKLIPMGAVTFIEFLLTKKCMKFSSSEVPRGGIIVKLRKICKHSIA